jgi:hypothetical protein
MMAALALLFSLVKVFGAMRAKSDQAQLACIDEINCNKKCTFMTPQNDQQVSTTHRSLQTGHDQGL